MDHGPNRSTTGRALFSRGASISMNRGRAGLRPGLIGGRHRRMCCVFVLPIALHSKQQSNNSNKKNARATIRESICRLVFFRSSICAGRHPVITSAEFSLSPLPLTPVPFFSFSPRPVSAPLAFRQAERIMRIVTVQRHAMNFARTCGHSQTAQNAHTRTNPYPYKTIP